MNMFGQAFKMGHAALVAVGAVLLTSLGLVAAASSGVIPNPFSTGGPEPTEFTGNVVSVSQFGLALRTDDALVSFLYTGDTQFFDSHGRPVSRDDVTRGMEATISALPRSSSRYWDALTVTLSVSFVTDPTVVPVPDESDPTPTPSPEPTVEPTKEPEPTPEPEPQVTWTEVHYEGTIFSVAVGSFVLKTDGVQRTFLIDSQTVVDGYIAAGAFADVTGLSGSDGTLIARHVTTYPVEFWAVVQSASSSSVVVKIEGKGDNVTLHRTAKTEIIGSLYPGVKVWVDARPKGDGSYEALRIEVKKAEFSGTVAAISGSTYTITVEGKKKTVFVNTATVFDGTPKLGSYVTVVASVNADGTYLAAKIIVKDTEEFFSGVITDHNPDAFTIYVRVGEQTKEVCYEFAEVVGTLQVGATVKVWVNHVDGPTFFASKVKVIE